MVGAGNIERFTPVAYNEVVSGSPAATSGDRRSGSATTRPFAFNGTIVRAQVHVTGPVIRDPVAEVAAILATQ